MSEEIPIIRNRVLTYEGLFKVKDIFDLINRFHLERNYDLYDRKHTAIDSKKGRLIEIQTDMDKQYTDDEIYRMKLFLTFSDLKDTEVTINGEKVIVNKGKAHIRFKGSLVVDENNVWQPTKGGSPNANGLRLLIRHIGSFFVFKHHLDAFKKDAKEDTEQLYQLIMDYFNARKYMR